jgi:serine protease Do
MWGTDLHRFQFDRGLTWAIFFGNADGTIYGRYGSRSATGKLSEKEISLAGFKKSLRGAIALHERYCSTDRETVAKELTGKSSRSKPVWSKPEDIPTLKSNPRFQKPFVGQHGRHGGCIHCHMVSTGELKSLRQAGKPIPDRKFFPYPLPDELGFHMDPEEMATVQRVKPHSIAAKAGLEPGDQILELQGQPILSTADIQWVIHNAGDKDTLMAKVSRRQEKKTLKLELPQDWRLGLSDWRFINMGLLRQTLGFNVNQMPKRRAQRLGLEGKMALVVNRTTRKLRRETGLGSQDLIVAIDGKREPMTVGAFTRYVFRNKKPGSKLKLTLLQIVDRFPRPELEVEVTVR